jgi:hypothetical protein
MTDSEMEMEIQEEPPVATEGDDEDELFEASGDVETEDDAATEEYDTEEEAPEEVSESAM